MFYKFKDDVYLVNGYCKSCIYDLDSGEVFNIISSVKDAIYKVLKEKDAYNYLSDDEKEYINTLVEYGILTPSDKKSDIVDISELKQNYPVEFCWIEVTRKCNLKCTFCYEESGPELYKKMTLNDFKIVVDNLKEIGVKSIQFIGGEPMVLGSSLKEMILCARPFFDYIEVYTNGVFIDSRWADFYKENGINIALSVHSYIPEEHDSVTTVKGSHKKVERAISYLKSKKVPYRVGAVKTSRCKVGERPKNSNYKIIPDNARLVGRGEIESYDFEMFKRKAITKDTKRSKINKKMVSRYVSGHQCFLKDFYIGTELDIYPCVMERRFSYGNLLKTRLSEVLDNDVRFLSKDKIDGCKDCEHRYNCFDCRPDSNGLGKFQKPWYCSYNPYTGEWADLKDMFNKLKKGIFHPSVYIEAQKSR